MPYQFHQHAGMGWGRGLLAFLFVLFVLAAVAWFAVAFSRQSGRTHHGHTHVPSTPSGPPTDALKILNERFAKGEIDAEEFTQRRDLLQSST
ncbi:MAG TPA: SHOCT domain-containing protein [Acidimicrobiales bacterium]|nr:SHOCT domain-containing protein [Acidimicrobiales bacterium]